MNRKEILDAAAACVLKDRNNDYGPPEDSFKVIADLWSAYLSRAVTSTDVAALLILLKVARSKASPSKDDHWVDVAGYAACGGEIATAGVEKKIVTDGPICHYCKKVVRPGEIIYRHINCSYNSRSVSSNCEINPEDV